MQFRFFTRVILSTMASLFFSLQLSAQDVSVSGTVSDEFGDPLIGLSVLLKADPGVGTVTDFEGKYTLTVPSQSSVLVFQYIGYKTVEQEVGAQREIDLTMKPDAEQLAEVQVTALGIKRQKREIGYSTESFDGVQLETSNAPNLVSALSGRSAGVQIASPNGVDGGTTRITIRGNNNFSGQNQPLIVVDGVPMENSPGMTDIARGQDWGSAINNINPADIESMNVLKGPTASALYGSRGANGVILITTKRGKKQKGIGINYSIQHKTIQPFRYRDVQNVYGAGAPSTFLEPSFPLNEEGQPKHPTNFYLDDGPLGESTTASFGFYGTGVSWGPRMEGQMIEWWDGEMRPFSPQPDNIKQFFDDGNTTTHNLSFSGGGEMGTMRVSLTRTDHNAIIPNSKFDQTTANVGANLNISSKLKADVALNFIHYNRLNSPTLGDDQQNSFAKGVIYSYPRSYKGLEEELNFAPDGTRFDYDGQYPFLYSGQNIWWNTYNNNTTFTRDKVIGSIALTYDPFSWLNITGRTGTDFNLEQFETRNNPADFIGIQDGFYSNELTRDFVINSDFLISTHKDKIFNSAFDVRFSVGAARWKRNLYGLKGQTNDWANPRIFAFENSLNSYAVNEIDENRAPEVRFDKIINSVYSFLNLSYNDYLFLELTGRNDWSSALPLNSNDYFYPSASLSFIPTEAFDIKWDFLNFWKIRGAIASTATDDNPFQLDRTYQIGNFGGNQTASADNLIPPIALVPQRAISYEIGTTIGLWDERVNLDLTYYYISSTDQILEAPLPSSAGANKIKINTGEITNQGLEAILNVNVIRRRNFFWETGLNISTNKNKVVSLGNEGATQLILAEIWDLNGPAIAVQAGDDFGTIIGYDYVYHENGGRLLNETGTHYQVSENRVRVGNAAPLFTGGWTMRFGYKGLSLSTLVDTKWGGDIYSGTYVSGLQNGQSPATLTERQGGGLPYTDPEGNLRNVGVILDGVYANGEQNDEVVHYLFKYIPNAGGWGRWLSSPGVIENTWVKLREVALTYQVPNRLTAKTKIFQDLTLSLVGRDLFYIYTTLPDRINPEGSNGSGNAQGLEWASYPGVRSFGFAVNAGF
ncbi:MAG: SusC/RagA family TonB-linked outer membrane protein [Saprospiraceae bacterium]